MDIMQFCKECGEMYSVGCKGVEIKADRVIYRCEKLAKKIREVTYGNRF